MIMAPNSLIFWCKHLWALVILSALDLHHILRRAVSRAFLRIAVIALSLSLLVMVLSGVIALRKVTHSVQSLIADSMVGLESSISMRAVVREAQLDLLRVQMTSDRNLPLAGVEAFQRKMALLLQEYRKGAFEAEDEDYARLVEQRLEDYVEALQTLIRTRRLDTEMIRHADRMARQLIDAVEQAYQFNRMKLRASAQEADDAARVALKISNRMWWSLAAFAAGILLIYLAYRWLALPEDSDA